MLKRFDNFLIRLRNPNLEELIQAFENIKLRISRNKSKALVFSFTGHAAQINNSLHCMLQDGSYFDLEREVKLISKNYPVFGFFDCNRIVLSEEEDLLANASLA